MCIRDSRRLGYRSRTAAPMTAAVEGAVPPQMGPYRRSSLEQGDGVDRGARDVLQAKRGDGQEELPAPALGTGLADLLEVAVVDEPEAHRHQAHHVEGCLLYTSPSPRDP